MNRIRFDVAVRPTKWLTGFAEAQDARVLGYNLSPAPASQTDPRDLRQATAGTLWTAYVMWNVRY